MVRKVSVAIVAHVDHGKSTFCDSVISLCTNTVINIKCPTLDSHAIEQARNVTIRNHFVSLQYQGVYLNVVDTPGHYDFYQYTRVGISVCDTVIILIDVTKGIQAQTIAYIQECQRQNKIIIPVLNKIDTNIVDKIDNIKQDIRNIIDCKDIIAVSAKNNINIEGPLNEVIKYAKDYVVSNNNNHEIEFQIIDCFKDYSTTVLFIKILTGTVCVGKQIYYKGKVYTIIKIEIKGINNVVAKQQSDGDFCYIHVNIRTNDIKEQNTLVGLKYYKSQFIRYIELIKPYLFVSLVYSNEKEYDKFLATVMYHQMSEQGVSIHTYNSKIYGRIIRCGFYGEFHKEIFLEKLSMQQYNKFKIYSPEIMYYNQKHDVYFMHVDLDKVKVNFKEYLRNILTPFYNITLQANLEFYNKIVSYIQNYALCASVRDTKFTADSVIFSLQLSSRAMCLNFIAKIKNITKGYANVIIHSEEYKKALLSLVEFSVNKHIISDLTFIELDMYAVSVANTILDHIQNNISREQFEMVINVLINKKIVMKRVIKPYRKDVTAHCYGGDSTRRSKLLKRQAKGKAKLLTQVNWQQIKSNIISIIRNE